MFFIYAQELIQPTGYPNRITLYIIKQHDQYLMLWKIFQPIGKMSRIQALFQIGRILRHRRL